MPYATYILRLVDDKLPKRQFINRKVDYAPLKYIMRGYTLLLRARGVLHRWFFSINLQDIGKDRPSLCF